MGKEKSYLGERLYKLIYNPELPKDWETMPDNRKIMMFELLFLFLSEDFQKEHGKNLDEWILQFPDLEEKKYSPNNPWFSAIHISGDNLIFIRDIKYGDNKLKINPGIVYELLKNRDTKYFASGIDTQSLFRDNPLLLDLFSHPKKVFDLMELSKKVEPELVDDMITIYFKTYIEERKKGRISPTVFPGVKIYYPKEELLKDFEMFID